MEESIVAFLKAWSPTVSIFSLSLSIWTIWDSRRRKLIVKINRNNALSGINKFFSIWIINKSAVSYVHSIIIYGIRADNSNHEIFNYQIVRLMQKGEIIEKRLTLEELRSFEAFSVKVTWHEGRVLQSIRYFVDQCQ